MKKLKLKSPAVIGASVCLLIVAMAIGGYYLINKNSVVSESVFTLDGTAYECSKPISGKSNSQESEFVPNNTEDLKNFCRPYNNDSDNPTSPSGCGPGGSYCIEYRAVIDILQREDVSSTISKYGSVRSSVKALGHKYIDDKQYLKRILPDYSNVAIDCIIVVHSPEGTRFFIENGEVHKNHDDHQYIEVPSEEFLASLNNAPDKDVNAFWLGLH